jgi:hypothetical protein
VIQCLAFVLLSALISDLRVLWFGVVLGGAFIAIGLKGLSEDGLPFSPERTITGRPARIIGIACIAFGAAWIVGMFILFLVMREAPSRPH